MVELEWKRGNKLMLGTGGRLKIGGLCFLFEKYLLSFIQ